MKRYMALAVSTMAVLTLSTRAAEAVSFGFNAITNNNAGDVAIGEAQLSVDVTAGPGGSQVSFAFHNAGPALSSIADVYFDDGSLLGIASIVNGAGTSFSQNATPADLPGGNSITPAFQTTAGFSADSDPPVEPNGVNPGEVVTIIFDLQSGKTFSDVLADLGSGALRIGIHVQGFASGGSESFTNTPVPEPSTLLVAGAGLLILGLMKRRGAT